MKVLRRKENGEPRVCLVPRYKHRSCQKVRRTMVNPALFFLMKGFRTKRSRDEGKGGEVSQTSDNSKKSP